jgi:cell division protein FtsW
MQSFSSSRWDRAELDFPLLWTVLILLGFGVVMVYSASIALAETSKPIGYRETYFLIRQAVYVLVALVVGFVAFQVRMETWQRWAPRLFLVGVITLILVLIPGVGHEVNGSRRWISLFIINFQPSELMKFLVLLYAADYTVRKAAHMDSVKRGFVPMGVAMFVVGALLLREPDFGALAVMTAISASILFLGGLNWRLFVGLLILLFVGFVLLVVLEPYRLNRLVWFWNPWADPFGKGYQLTHSLIAIGRGGIFGVGLGASVEKQLFLPEAHTDFLLAVIGEELGFLGIMITVVLFGFLVWRSFRIANRAAALQNYFSALVAQGVGVWIGAQTFVNVGVNMGMLPTKGLTLPLLSYGGSGIISNVVAFAVLLRIDYETRQQVRGV